MRPRVALTPATAFKTIVVLIHCVGQICKHEYLHYAKSVSRNPSVSVWVDSDAGWKGLHMHLERV